jgi:hypothetical protein
MSDPMTISMGLNQMQGDIAPLIVDRDLEGFLYAQGFLLPTNCSDGSIK